METNTVPAQDSELENPHIDRALTTIELAMNRIDVVRRQCELWGDAFLGGTFGLALVELDKAMKHIEKLPNTFVPPKATRKQRAANRPKFVNGESATIKLEKLAIYTGLLEDSKTQTGAVTIKRQMPTGNWVCQLGDVIVAVKQSHLIKHVEESNA